MRATSLLTALALTLVSTPALAQLAPPTCFTDAHVPGWNPVDLGDVTTGAAEALSAATGPLGFRICSDGEGYGLFDALRTMHQPVDGDFTLSGLLLELDEGAEAGLEVRTVARVPDAARVRITASKVAGSTTLVAEARVGASVTGVSPLPVSLPVFLRLERMGGAIVVHWSSNGRVYTPLFTFDTTGTPLATTTLAVGAAVGTPLASTPGTAHFSELQLFDGALPPDAVCTQATVSPTGATITIDGTRLSQVTQVRVAGELAQVLDQSDRRLRVAAPRPSPAMASGGVVLQMVESKRLVGDRITFAGSPFIRGDVNEDGAVNSADLAALQDRLQGRAGLLPCEAAADVDADGDVDSGDAARLRSFLRYGRAAPPAPFPTAGYSPFPAPACGLGASPTIESLVDSAGRPLTASTLLREGDTLELRGQNLPVSPDTNLYFGDTRLERVSPGSATSLQVRVGVVPSTGNKCPRLFTPTDSDPTLTSQFGLVLEVRPDTLARDLCPRFEASSGVAGAVRWNPSTNEGRIEISRTQIDPARGAQVDLLLSRPAVTGSFDRGSREVSVFARANDSAQSYESMLDRLAAALDTALNGGAPRDNCGVCDFEAFADPIAGELGIRVCNAATPGPLPPAPPPHTTQIAKMKPSIVGSAAGTVAAKKPTCDDPNIEEDSRLEAWCAYKAATKVSNGMPAWERSVPQSMFQESWWDILNQPVPSNRSVSDKRIMINYDAWQDASNNGYFDPCAQAARVVYCDGYGSDSAMPEFRPSAHVYKGFWRRYDELPASANASDLYSYDPPDGPRQYLVGMHVSYSAGDRQEYFKWATFWFPRGTDTMTKGGHPLAEIYNPSCSTGSFADQPAGLTGVWSNYVMCINDENGGTPCGNPWGPTNECSVQTCAECHQEIRIPFPGQTMLGWLQLGWMSSLTRSAPVKACYEEILAGIDAGEEPYVNLKPAECQ